CPHALSVSYSTSPPPPTLTLFPYTTLFRSPDVLDVIITSLFNVPVYQGYGRAIGHRQYVPPGFDLVLGMKDVGLALKAGEQANVDRKSTRLNSSHQIISYAVFCLKKKNK